MKDQIIKDLRVSTGYLSGEEISRRLNISRAGVWKNIEELRKDGYLIEAIPHRGYRLQSCPDRLFSREIKSQLTTKRFGQNIQTFDEIDSTMNAAFRLGLDNAKEGTLVIAETQNKGKGRLGREWISPKYSGLYFSLILRPTLSPTDVAKLTLLCGVAVAEATEKVCGVNAQIKWPNDVLISNKKVCGILTEMHAEMDGVRFVVVGIGINVNTLLDALPENGTSLQIESGKKVNRIDLLNELIMRLEHWYDLTLVSGFENVLNRWRKLTSTLGTRIQMDDVIGEATDLDQFGGLVIRTDRGDLVKRMSGDVVLLGVSDK